MIQNEMGFKIFQSLITFYLLRQMLLLNTLIPASNGPRFSEGIILVAVSKFCSPRKLHIRI